MKKIKELKRKLASALIVALIGTSIAMPSFADAQNNREIVVESEETGEMSINDERTLEAFYASPSSASPSEAAEATWKIDKPNVVKFVGNNIASPTEASSSDAVIDEACSEVTIKAVGAGTATVTAKVGSKTYGYKVTVKSGARIDISPTTNKTIAYSEKTVVTGKVRGGSEDSVIEYNIDISPANGLTELEEEFGSNDSKTTGKFILAADKGLYGTYDVKVTATVDGENLESKSIKITVEKPVIKLVAADELDLNGKLTTVIGIDEAKSEFTEYTDFKWTSSNPEVLEIATPTDASEINVIANKEGTSVIKLEASAVIEGPEVGNFVTSADTTLTVNVADTRAFEVPEDAFVELDINPDPEFNRLSEILAVLNNYGDTKLEVQKADGTDEKTDISKYVIAEVISSTDNNGYDDLIISVPDDLKQVGVANVVVSSEAAGQKGIVRVIVKDSTSGKFDTENDVKVDTTVPAIKTPKLPAKTEDGELIPDEVKAEIEAEIAAKTADLINTVQAILENANSDPEYKETLKSAFDISDEAIKALAAANEISLNAGDTISVAPVQKLADVQVEARVVKNEDGTYSTEVVITSIRYDIDLQISKKDATGKEYATQNINNFDADVEFDIPIPLPSSIPEDANQVHVEHAKDSAYDDILTAPSDDKYTVHTAKSCSPFKLSKFTNNTAPTPTPTPSGNRRNGGGHGSSLSSGKWIQDNIGWWYKYYDGTWPANTWKSLLWNNSMQWYRFNPEGYMVTGWFTDVDGNKYFLHNISDGRQGMMYTGWNQIEGKWYYFRENVGGPLGSLTVNGVTPDGYTVDINGVAQGYPRQ